MPSSIYFRHNGARRTRPCGARSRWLSSIRATEPSGPPNTHPCASGAGQCAANIGQDRLNLDAPKELLNLDVLHKRSTARNVEAMHHGRFPTAPRKFFGEDAVDRSNYSVPSRLFLDPYHVADGNLWAENFLMARFQKGGMTSLAGRSSILKFEKERMGKEDSQSRARSKYLEPEGAPPPPSPRAPLPTQPPAPTRRRRALHSASQAGVRARQGLRERHVRGTANTAAHPLRRAPRPALLAAHQGRRERRAHAARARRRGR